MNAKNMLLFVAIIVILLFFITGCDLIFGSHKITIKNVSDTDIVSEYLVSNNYYDSNLHEYITKIIDKNEIIRKGESLSWEVYYDSTTDITITDKNGKKYTIYYVRVFSEFGSVERILVFDGKTFYLSNY